MEFSKDGPPAEMIAEWKNKLIQSGAVLKENIDTVTVEEMQHLMAEEFKNSAPTSAATAARIILTGIKNGETRILVGEDAVVIDWLARMFPRLIYNDYFLVSVLFPWMVGARVVGGPIGRFIYPVVLGLAGWFGVKSIGARL